MHNNQVVLEAAYILLYIFQLYWQQRHLLDKLTYIDAQIRLSLYFSICIFIYTIIADAFSPKVQQQNKRRMLHK